VPRELLKQFEHSARINVGKSENGVTIWRQQYICRPTGKFLSFPHKSLEMLIFGGHALTVDQDWKKVLIDIGGHLRIMKRILAHPETPVT